MNFPNRPYYIASCVFTSRYPELSEIIQAYVRDQHHFQIVRCCVPQYQLKRFEDAMPPEHQEVWCALPDTGDFSAGDTVYSICHNCSAIIEESRPNVNIRSLWELILSDSTFPYPDYGHRAMTLQDCWRAQNRWTEQDAVRMLLKKMNIDTVELADNYEKTNFCGNSLYRPAPVRNLKLAPHRFVEQAEGKFEPHTAEEQRQLMQEYVKRFQTDSVVAYCHYCVEGLELGGIHAKHIASLLFEPEKNKAVGYPQDVETIYLGKRGIQPSFTKALS